jgi:hypothetical protein
LLALNITRINVAANAGETRVTQSLVGRPLEELNARNEKWFEPAAFCYLGSGHSLVPVALAPVPQVDERTSWRSQFIEI